MNNGHYIVLIKYILFKRTHGPWEWPTSGGADMVDSPHPSRRGPGVYLNLGSDRWTDRSSVRVCLHGAGVP